MTGPEALKAARKAAKMTQAQLADAVGVTLGAVQQWEQGRYVPRQKVAKKVDRALKADGAVLSAFGYAPDQRLTERVQRNENALNEIRKSVASIRADLEAMKRAQPGPKAQPRLRRVQPPADPSSAPTNPPGNSR